MQACLPQEAFLHPFQQKLFCLGTLPPFPFALYETPPEPLSPMLPLFPSALHPALSWLLSIFCMTAIESTDGTRELPGGSGGSCQKPTEGAEVWLLWEAVFI